MLAPCTVLPATVLSATVLSARPAAASSAAASPDGMITSQNSAIVAGQIAVRGHGFGHGDGLSQWGAYGYAVNQHSDWTAILAHYYGGTTLGTVAADSQMSVSLTALEGRPFAAFVQPAGTLTASSATSVHVKSLVAFEIPSTSTYRVFGRSDVTMCPAATAVLADFSVANGWSVIGGDVTSTSMGASKLDITATGVDPATADVASLVGVCQPDGTVIQHRGTLRAVNGTAGESRTVVMLPLEQYVRDVVPRESPASWGDSAGGSGMNALRAQAVAARTYAMASSYGTYSKTCDSQSCQVYGGAGRLATPTAAVEVLEDHRADQAVTDTSLKVLLNSVGGYAFAQFSSSSGGYTSGANFPAVEDLGDAAAPAGDRNWTATITAAAIEAAWPAIGTLLRIDVTQRNGLGEWGGRVLQLKLTGTRTSVLVAGEVFRGRMGLKSAWFDLPNGCNGPPTAPAVPAPAAATFHALTPTRLLDTREGRNSAKAPVQAGCVLALSPDLLLSLPAEATAVALNVTVADAQGPGYLTVYPCDQGLPVASNVNYAAGQTVANQVIAPLTGSKDVCIFSYASANVVVDALGWFGGSSGSRFTSIVPARAADTRSGIGVAPGLVGAGAVLTVDVAHVLPAGANPNAVALNVTASDAPTDGYLTVYSCSDARPVASNVNVVAGRAVPNHVLAGVSAAGTICVYSALASHVIVDVLGWFGTTGDLYRPVAPSRLIDTRKTHSVGAGGTVQVPILGQNGLPSSGLRTVTVDVTATLARSAGYLTVYPCGQPQPLASNLNPYVGSDVANLVTVPVGANGDICIYALRDTDVVVDVTGWYGP